MLFFDKFQHGQKKALSASDFYLVLVVVIIDQN